MDDVYRRAALQQLEALRLAGVEQLARPSAADVARLRQSAAGELSPDTAPQVMEDSDVTTRQPGSPADALAVVQQEVAGCTRCAELAATRTQTVFGVGNPQARLVFVGEAPGANEDKQGEPFVGRAGKLLTDIVEKGMKLTRNDVYILNVLKCRPPKNRNPLPDEVANCRNYLDRQLEVIRPEYLCCLGAVAAHTLLDCDTPIGRMRGSFHDYRGIPVLCTYHPAYLLRNPPAKKDAWADIQILMRAMGLPVD